MSKKRWAGFYRDVLITDRNIACVEVNGSILGCQYADGYFDNLTDEQILDKIRKEYKESPKSFKPYNQSTGYFI